MCTSGCPIKVVSVRSLTAPVLAPAAGGAAGEWRRQDVPVVVVPAQGPAEATLTDLVSLMRMLLREERAAYRDALAAAARPGGGVDPLAALHHTATFQQHVCKLIELLLGASML